MWGFLKQKPAEHEAHGEKGNFDEMLVQSRNRLEKLTSDLNASLRCFDQALQDLSGASVNRDIQQQSTMSILEDESSLSISGKAFEECNRQILLENMNYLDALERVAKIWDSVSNEFSLFPSNALSTEEIRDELKLRRESFDKEMHQSLLHYDEIKEAKERLRSFVQVSIDKTANKRRLVDISVGGVLIVDMEVQSSRAAPPTMVHVDSNVSLSDADDDICAVSHVHQETQDINGVESDKSSTRSDSDSDSS